MISDKTMAAMDKQATTVFTAMKTFVDRSVDAKQMELLEIIRQLESRIEKLERKTRGNGFRHG